MDLKKKITDKLKKKDQKTKEIIKQKAKAYDEITKLLLLGAGESGKTTVFKQMQLLYTSGFNEDYRKKLKPSISYNLVLACSNVLRAMTRFGYELQDDDSKKAAAVILENKRPGLSFALDQEIVDSLLLLSKSADFQKTVEERSKFQLMDSWEYFLDKVVQFPVWGGENWLPNDEDILMARVRTTGVVQKTFSIDSAKFQIIDVGGQRSERRKWMRLFQGVTGLIFVASLSEYDLMLYEDSNTRRIDETLNLWKKYANISDFQDAALILFLNKFDLFQAKYYHNKVPIEFNGEFVNSPNGYAPPKAEEEEDEKCAKALQWYSDLFHYHLDQNRKSALFVHVTTALNPKNMKTVVAACTHFILQQHIVQSGFIG
mmetsp:Transcript_8208/g.9414  ORF Transcript_8208/g.9414 Transcript_8208/m.9414 type:complete len:373 (+) Transcript_8208:242-1360(+)